MKSRRAILFFGQVIAVMTAPLAVGGALLTNATVDGYAIRVGTQTFGPRYSFSSTNVLVETALAMRGMGSDTIKFAMGSGAQGQYGITFPGGITSLETQARNEPICRQVLDLPFRHFLIWANTFTVSSAWTDGLSATERQNEYNEIYAFSRYVLTNYNNSGKSFYLGHWEGDWYLLPGYDTSTNPSPTRLQGMRDWLNTRQLAVDDAMRLVPHTNVNVFQYTEVNRVRDAMVNGPANNQRLVNAVLPAVTNLDYVSWSAYDGQNLGSTDLYATLDYIALNLGTNKAAAIPGRRVFVGEYGWGKTYNSAGQELPTRAFLQKLLGWGVPFMLFWEMYNNEPGYQFWLIDDTNTKTPCYFLHQNFGNEARLVVARFQESNGRVPTPDEFETLMQRLLGAPLRTPPALFVANAGPTTVGANTATVTGLLRQNLYGDEPARVRVFWGPQDGGTTRGNWQHELLLATNTNFNTTIFATTLTNLAAGTNFFRFHATNVSGEVWAAASTPFTLSMVDSNAFGYRMKFTFSGYNLREPLANFPVLLKLGTNLPGFSYRQFASVLGGDLRFAGGDGRVPLLHEVDEWNTNGSSLAWVRIPLLSATNDSVWAYWGNPAAATLPASATNGTFWYGDHELVWHLKETALPFVDSAGLHPATSGVAPTSTTAGIIGRGAAFDGSTQFLNAGPVNLGNRFTVSAWVKVAANAGNIQTVWANKASGFNSDGFGLFVNSYQTADGRLAFEGGDGVNGSRTASAASAVPANQWQHVAVAVDRTNNAARLFVNGVELTGAATIENDFRIIGDLMLGRFTNGLYSFSGTMDEVRVAKTTLSGDWLRASYLNGASNNTFAVSAAVTPNVPALAASVSGGELLLTWPGQAVGYTLYTTTNLASPIFWSLATNAPGFTGGQWQVKLPVDSGPSRFFRLQGP